MPTVPLPNEKELLLLISEGDEYQFIQLFRHYQDPIFKILWKYVKSHSIAEELVQDIFLKVWQDRSKLAQIERFDHWLFIITRNHVLNYLKRVASDEKARAGWATEHPLYENSTDYRLRESTFSTLLQEIIHRLPTQQQAVFRLAREQNLSYAEIAEQLSISANTVRIHMSRALQHIRQELKAKGILLSSAVLLFNLFVSK
jgi:RNA polymerase sigma-70 factor (family 1)